MVGELGRGLVVGRLEVGVVFDKRKFWIGPAMPSPYCWYYGWGWVSGGCWLVECGAVRGAVVVAGRLQ